MKANGEQEKECAWCGCPEEYMPTESRPEGYWNNRGEWFCCKAHRDSNNRALKRLTDSDN